LELKRLKLNRFELEVHRKSWKNDEKKLREAKVAGGEKAEEANKVQ